MQKDTRIQKMHSAHHLFDQSCKSVRAYVCTLDEMLIDAQHQDTVSKSFLEHMQRQRRIAASFLHESSVEISTFVHELYQKYADLAAEKLFKE